MINCSTSFLFRARCKYCGGKPRNYFITMDKFIPRQIDGWLNMKMSYLKKDKDPYKKNNYVINLNNFIEFNKFSNSFSTIDIKYWKNFKQIANYGIKEFLTCNCRNTMWAHSDFLNKNFNPLSNGRCKYEAPIYLRF